VTANSTKSLETKKPYKSPKVRVYGDIGTLTGTSGTMSSTADSGMGLNNKT
jgi:hypothetical protein